MRRSQAGSERELAGNPKIPTGPAPSRRRALECEWKSSVLLVLLLWFVFSVGLRTLLVAPVGRVDHCGGAGSGGRRRWRRRSVNVPGTGMCK